MIEEHNLTREDTTNLFLIVANMCEPDHKYLDNENVYPLSKGCTEVTWNRSDSNTWATCGPRRGGNYAKYSVDLKYFNRQSLEKVLSITTHEIVHLEIVPSHPPEFWERMCDFAEIVIDNWEIFKTISTKDISIEKYKQEIINDPNAWMVDKRSETLRERRERMEERMEAI